MWTVLLVGSCAGSTPVRVTWQHRGVVLVYVVVDNALSLTSPLANAAGALIRRARPAGRPATRDDDPELEAPCESSTHEVATRGLRS